MKTSKYLKTIAFCALMLAAAMPGKAQVFPNTYINIDWQVGVPLGANYAEMSSYYYIIKQYTDTWGFYLSPEIGVSIFPRPDYRLGFHVALYYSYSTNSGDVLTYSMDNINNFGIRVGISF